MQGPDNETVENRAAYWVAREDHAALDASAKLERDAWLSVDRRHLGAYARAHAVFARTARARVLANHSTATDEASRPLRMRTGVKWAMGLAACVALTVSAMWIHQKAGHQYSTTRGEVLRVVLEDGSVATLNANTSLRVRYTRKLRQIQMLRGEALFDVAKHRSRAFVVHADGTSVTAVGTSFAVNLPSAGPGNVEVLVREGVVDVTDDAGHAVPARLPANHRALAVRDGGIRVDAMPEREVGAALAWREGMLSFGGDTLSVAAARFQRYSDQRIVIDDPSVGSLRIVGLYAANDPAGFARSVSVSLGLRVEQQGDVIRLLAPFSSHRYPAPVMAVKDRAMHGQRQDKQVQERQ